MKEEKNQINVWKVLTIVFAILFLIAIIFAFKGNITGNVISEEKASEKLLNYLNSLTGGGVSYVSYEDLGNVYEITVKYQGQEIPVYITKDGKYIIQGISEIQEPNTITGNVVQEQQEVPKSDKPKVELFVMTHCPYGTQAEKGILETIKTLENKIDFKIRFVHYFMHGDKEEDETYTQVCIREEQSSKFNDYLACFLEDGNSSRCLNKVNIDKTKLDSCKANKAKSYYAIDSQSSKQYGVQGSPTLIINGVEVSSGRSPAAYLSTICSAFNNKPNECSLSLSTTTPSPGFGYNAGSSSSGSCG
ncbi:MAG: thioredoxin domain-containing protein [Candidatus Pacearchaeota archaeon]